MIYKLLLSVIFALTLHAQTLGQFRLVDFSPRTAGTVTAVTLGANPAITCTACSSLTTGSSVYIFPMWTVTQRETDGVGDTKSGNRGRGYFVVTVADATHFTLASEMYSGATDLSAYVVAAGDKIIPLVTYTLRDGPRLWLDGPIDKGAWSSGTTYRSHEMVTSGGSSYMSIADSNTNHTPPNSTWWVSVDPAKVGPGTFTASLRNTSGKASVAGAYTPLAALQNVLATYLPNTDNFFDYTMQRFGGLTGWATQHHALNWFMTGDTTSYTRASRIATHAEDLAAGTVGCDGTEFCGARNSNDLDYDRLDDAQWMPAVAMLYDTFTPSQKVAFRDRILNDNDVLHNGIEAAGQGCTPETYRTGLGTFSVTGNTTTGVEVIAGSGFSSLVDLQAGSVILQDATVNTSLRVLGRVKTVDSDTQLTLEPIVKEQVLSMTNVTGKYVRPWAYLGAKTCGWSHLIKHVPATPHMIPGQEANWVADYGAGENDWDTNNRTISGLAPFIAVSLMLGQDDIRAVRLGEQAINYYMTQTMAQYYKSRMTGKDGHGTEYGTGRTENLITEIAVMLKNSLTVTPAGVTTGNYLHNILASYQYVPWNSRTGWLGPWGVGYPAVTKDDPTEAIGSALYNMGKPMLYAAYLLPSDPFVGPTYEYFRTRRTVSAPFWTTSFGDTHDSWFNPSFLSVAVPFYDPLATATAVSSKPATLIQTSSDIAECIAAGLYCVADSNISHVWSSSGWSASDTQVTIDGATSAPIGNEDSYGTAGNITILQNNGGINGAYLLGGNGLGVNGYGAGVTPSSGTEHGNTISFWDAAAGEDLFPGRSEIQYAAMDRSASGTGYLYARVNLTPTLRDPSLDYDPNATVQKSAYASSAGATAVTREVVHFTGGTNHVIVYDSAAASAAHQIRAYWHYEVADIAAASPVRHPDWLTSLNTSGRTAVLTVPSVGRLSSKMLPVAGSNSIALVAENAILNAYYGSVSWCDHATAFNPSGSCAGNYTYRDVSGPGVSAAVQPGTYRLHVCASTNGSTCANATSGEWITVHRASTSGSDTMPTIVQPSCTATGGQCSAVEVQDASAPVVAVFARSGDLLTNTVFATSHSGSAQYVITGLTSGHYTVFRDGSSIATVDVADGENSLGFASAAGTFSLSSEPVLTATPSSLSYACTVGGSASPQSVAVAAVGATLDQWSASKTAAWLTLAPTSGTAAGSITASVSCSGLAVGSYSDTITVTSSTTGISNSPMSVPVDLTVGASIPAVRGAVVKGRIIR